MAIWSGQVWRSGTALPRLPGERAPISLDAASSPSLGGGAAAWATNPYFDRDPGLGWAVQTYNLRTGATTTMATGLDANTWRFVALADRVAYLTRSGQGTAQSLNLARVP